MSRFTNATHFEMEFEGDTIKISMQRMKRADYIKLAPFATYDDATGETTVRFKDQVDMMNMLVDVLPKYIKRFEGLLDDVGNEIKFKTVLEEAYFTGLVTDLVMKLFETSGLASKGGDESEEVIKN